MTLPGMPGSQVSNDGDIMRIIADLQRQVRELAAQNVLATAGITTQTNGVTVNGSLTVNGAMSAANASITGTVNQSNSWGNSYLGGVLTPVGTPALVFGKNGSGYAAAGLGMGPNAAGVDGVLLSGAHATSPAALVLNSNQTFGLTSDSNSSASAGPYVQSTAGTTGALALAGGATNGSVNLLPYGTGKCQVYGNFAVTGTKAFIMDHPVSPDTMELMHAATESPVNGVEYWGTVTLDLTGQATATLPTYFESLTKTAGRNIQLTPIGRTAVQVSADRIVAGAFTIYGAPGQEVDWLVKAARQNVVDGYDELSFPAEQYKPLIGPQLPEVAR